MPTAIAPTAGVAFPGVTGHTAPTPPERGEATPAKGLRAWEGDSFSFGDIIDMINPLQHLPVVGTLYRAITGDEIGVASRVAGSTLYGGPIGLVASLVETAITDITGKSPTEHLVAAVEDIFPGHDGPAGAGEAVAHNRDGAEGALVRTGHHPEGEPARAAHARDDNWYDDEPAGTDVAEITGQSADDAALAEMGFDDVPYFIARIQRFDRSAPAPRATAVAAASSAPKPAATTNPAPQPAAATSAAPEPAAARRPFTARSAPTTPFMPSRPVPLSSRALTAAQIMAASPQPAPQFSALPSSRGPADPSAFVRLLGAAQGGNGAAPGHTAPLAASATIARALARYGATEAMTPPLPAGPATLR